MIYRSAKALHLTAAYSAVPYALTQNDETDMLLSAKQETSRLLKEDAEERQVRQMVMQRQAAQQKSPLRSVWKKNDFER